MLGILGFVRDGVQIGPGKTLDSSVNHSSLSNFLTLLHATSRFIAKNDIARVMKDSYAFLEKANTIWFKTPVHGFHRSWIITLNPIPGLVEAISRYVK